MTKKLPVAVVQAAPVPLAVAAGIARAVELTERALRDGARVVAFGETYLGGYPLWLDEAAGAALWDHPGTKALHRILLEHAVTYCDPRLAALQELADRYDGVISVGGHERIRRSLYNTQFLLRSGQPPLAHRKLVPTHGERLMWARGDGASLAIHDAGWGKVGHLICWEHWMPLARAAMHNLCETVHIAAWPTVRESYAIASRHYAMEGRCFVLAAGLVQTREDLFDGLERVGGDGAVRALFEEIPDRVLNAGGSLIVAPDARILAQAGQEAEILTAELPLDQAAEGLASLDTDGHYARPDIFELTINRRKHAGIVWAEAAEA